MPTNPTPTPVASEQLCASGCGCTETESYHDGPCSPVAPPPEHDELSAERLAGPERESGAEEKSHRPNDPLGRWVSRHREDEPCDDCGTPTVTPTPPQERITDERLAEIVGEYARYISKHSDCDCLDCSSYRIAIELQQRREADRLLVEVELTAMERRCGALPEGR